MVKQMFSRLGTWFVSALFMAWGILRFGMDWIGRSTTGDDFEQLIERLPKVLQWLLSTPWQVPSILAACVAVFLIWLNWSDRKVGVATPVNRSQPNQAAAGRIDDLPSNGKVENSEVKAQMLVSDIRVARADDVSSRYWVTFEVKRSMHRLDICLDLQVGNWVEVNGAKTFSWSRKTRHVMRSMTDVVAGQTALVQVVDDRPDYFETRAPHWNVGNNSVDGSGWIPSFPSFQRAAIVFLAEGEEQSYRMIALPRDINHALCLISANMFEESAFWDKNDQFLTLRLVRGLRELTTPEARIWAKNSSG